MVECPTTGALVPTGVDCDTEDFMTAFIPAATLRTCPECGDDHDWTKREAVLEHG